MQLRLQKPYGREQIAALIIYCCIALTLFSVIGVRALEVQAINIEAVDRALYTVITQKGPVNVESNDVLRIERTYTKAAVTGAPVEIDKIYTTKGFIYSSSTDYYYENTRQLINSVDFDGLAMWERENTTWQSVQPYAYAIGTPKSLIPWLFFLLSIQYYMLSIGGLALIILTFPLPWKELKEENRDKRLSKQPQEQDFSSEEQLSSAAK
ncbi:hypothetical protein [Desulfitobacterium metallireducens]|uniref:Uncharacterized protein n=1 Tax=Desulfitobacterium metallireducens DSM 15288 TaxID=871968 RepID=W0EBK1_9FIRM|nr:hypothetical protein [Desulfitobacterium metallireducens]AHF06913.1 hypothetical protein DESME_07410 [Desulfitobacterium metallireducens DSM 15288]